MTVARLTFATTFTALLSSLVAAQSPSGTRAPTSVASLYSSNPSAFPLTSINSAQSTGPTAALSTTAAPGASAPISGAPPIPSFVFSPSLGYPALDQLPPTDSAQVKQWIQEVQNSGVKIPNIAKSTDGSCASDPGRVANTSICWWTCGGCTRDTDITACPDKNTWGVSYDDGPSPYTPSLLNYLNANNVKSTFFIVGSRAISRPDVLQAEYVSGHQLSVHTWSHPYLTTLSNEQIIAELGWTRKAIKDVTGVTPNTMRPPYGDIDDRVRAICKAMGLTPIMWSNNNGQYFDTEDWHIPSGQSVVSVIDNFAGILNNASSLSSGFIVLAHDLYLQTVELATGYILPDALARKSLKLKSIIDCLNQPLGNAYVETNNNKTNPPGAATTLSSSPGSSGTPQGGQTTPGAAPRALFAFDPMFVATAVTVVGLVVGVSVVL